ncbi:MAG: hypothetical protein ACD_22C00042G0004, partial [uncultured bacterium]
TDLGTNSLFVAHSITKGENPLNRFMSLKFLLFLVALPVSIFILLFFNLADTQTLIIFLLGLLAYAINFALFGLFQQLEDFVAVVAVNTIPALIKGIFAVLIFFGLITLNYEQAFIVFSLSVVPSLVLWWFLPKDYRKLKFTMIGVRQLFFETLPAGISLFISEGWAAIANGIAKIAQGYAQVGIYSVAEKISSVFTLLSLAIFTVLLPKNAKNKKELNKYDFTETILLSIGILLVSGAAIVAARIGVPIVFGDKFNESIKLLDIMILASAITAIHAFMENYFYVERKTKVLFSITTTKLLVFLGASFLLVPAYSLNGLAYAQLASALVALALTVYIFNKHKSHQL